MAATTHIEVIESEQELQGHLSRVSPFLRPRIKMLLLIAGGITRVSTLCAKLKVSGPTLVAWKARYKEGGLRQLLLDRRGGDYTSGLSAEQKQGLCDKVHDPNSGLRSYGQLQRWAKEDLGVEKSCNALYKMVRRNWEVKFKVGRKSHIKKDPQAVEDYKKNSTPH